MFSFKAKAMDYPKRKIAKSLSELPVHPQQPAMGWTIYDSHWQVDSYWPDGTHKEKIAYTNRFYAAEAAYNTALEKEPGERIRFGNRMRTIRQSWKE